MKTVRGRRLLSVALYSVVILGLLGLYAYDLDAHGYWEDEIYTARDIGILHISEHQPNFRLSFSELTYRNNNHPPLYFWMVSQWAAWFGFSEKSGRGFSLIVLGALLGVLAWAARRWVPEHRWAPLWVLLLFGSSSYLVSITREARMYTLALLWIALSLHFFSQYFWSGQQKSRLNLLGLGFVNTLGLYTHYYFALIYVAQLPAGLYGYLRRRAALKEVAALFVPALLFLPWLPQLMRQYEIKIQEGLWIKGPADGQLYYQTVVKEGAEALSKLVFGSSFEAWTIAKILALAAFLYWISRKAKGAEAKTAVRLLGLAAAGYLLLVGNDLYHHTLTLTRTKYLFFLLVPVLMSYLLLALGSFPPLRVALLAVFLSYNFATIVRDRMIPVRPDWRAIARQAGVLVQKTPVVVPDFDYWTCLRFYLPLEYKILSEEALSVYPEEFWYLVVYLPWSENMQQRVAALGTRFVEWERINPDRFSVLIRYTIKP